MKLVSWNVNGLRACVNKGFNDYFAKIVADIFCIQEAKLQDGQICMELGEEYTQYSPLIIDAQIDCDVTVLKTGYFCCFCQTENTDGLAVFPFGRMLIMTRFQYGSDHCPVILLLTEISV